MPARLARLKDAASAPGRFVVSSDGPVISNAIHATGEPSRATERLSANRGSTE